MIGFARCREGGLAALDIALAQALHSAWPAADDDALLLAALASWAVAQGHSGLDASLLRAHAHALFADAAEAARVIDLLDAPIPAAPFIGRAEDVQTPLVVEAGRAWLRRYWRYEREIEDDLRARAALVAALPDPARVRAELDRLLPPASDEGTDWQRVAAVVALRSPLAVICGGPGTGKTFTVLRVLVLLQCFAASPLRIALAAPTGKAAQRLGESVRAGLDALDPGSELRACLPHEATTLHRLLGFRPQAVDPRHDRARPLDLDVLVVDEGSMVDLPMMARLLRALPASARLILLGDPDQLPAVENGAVLATLATCNHDNTFSPGASRWIGAASGEQVRVDASRTTLADGIVRLERPRRFGGDSGIARLVRAIRLGDAERVFDVLAGSDDITWHAAPRRFDGAEGVAALRAAHADLLAARTPGEALAALGRFRLLCALREGPSGVAGLNLAVGTALHGAQARDTLHAGRPILVTRNDAALGLYNGDVGILFGEAPAAPLRAWFARNDGELRACVPAQLPVFESAYAMTVHKAQGSEFDTVDLVLPSKPHPLLTREWLYTAASRARRRLVIEGSREVIAAALARPVERFNGLDFASPRGTAQETL
ncbi:MAG: exodeoxyribonuclease V subunit alpha [Xanthomonadales bacterium]|nr:exodeoxyribonuclease V subunit alpha [Xanthomonadales bacterium]